MAILVDHFHLNLNDISNLTPKQVDSIYFHSRNKDGSIKPNVSTTFEKKELTYEEAQIELYVFYANHAKPMNITEQDYERMKKELDIKYGK